jgi:hypothetical protein
VIRLAYGSSYEGYWHEDQLVETTAEVHHSHDTDVYLKYIDERMYHSKDRPIRQTASNLVYAKDFSADRKGSSSSADEYSSQSDSWTYEYYVF